MTDNAKLFCRFEYEGRTCSGFINGGTIEAAEGDVFSGTVLTGKKFNTNDVKFLPPVMPKTLWCIGRNYVGHVKELEHEIPKEPMVFIKSTSAVTGAGDEIIIPDWPGVIHYEGEVAVVIGRDGKNISEADACSYVLGYTIMNDVTARALQKIDGQWARAKSFDTFAPLGPALLLQNELPQNTIVTTRVNGKTVQNSPIELMIFPIPRLISHISRFATLHAGDIISTGTPQGVGEIKAGDIVEVEVSGIGVLKNHAVQQQ